MSQNYIFIALLPVALALSYIKTLKRLAIASACANILQAGGIAIIIKYLITEMPREPEVKLFKPLPEVALGFGSAMFAFEGIAVVLPVYSRMKRPEQIGGYFGIINVSYLLLLILYFSVGVLGYLKFGDGAEGSITINLPKGHLYNIVRGVFATSIFLTYPLQFYVPYEIIWNGIKSKFSVDDKAPQDHYLKFNYLCRTILVLITFILAMTVPKLNLMMDLVGSISGTALSITLPAIIHLTAFWEDTSGSSKLFMIIVDLILIMIGIIASASGSYFSFMGIIHSFAGSTDHHIAS